MVIDLRKNMTLIFFVSLNKIQIRGLENFKGEMLYNSNKHNPSKVLSHHILKIKNISAVYLNINKLICVEGKQGAMITMLL